MAGQVSSLDAVKKILAGGSMPGEKKGGDRKTYKLPLTVDEVRLRVLPQKDDPSFPIKISIYHYDMPGVSKSDKEKERAAKNRKEGEKERGASIKCLQMYGIDCPICKVLKKYEGKAELEDWAARISGIANVLVKDDPTQRIDVRVPHLVYFSRAVIDWFTKLYNDPKEGAALVNPNNGYDVIINRKKYSGAFNVRTGLSASPLADSPAKIKEIMAQAYNLNEVVGKADDNLVTRTKEAARFLEAEIEAQIAAKSELAEGTDGGVPDFDPDQQVGEFEEETTETEAEGTEVTEGEGTETEEETQPEETETKPAKATKTQAKAPPKPAPSKAATKAAPKPAAAKEAKGNAKPAAKPANKTKAAVNKPAGAPDCYADDSVHDAESDKCLECPHEFHCENAIQQAKA